LAIFKHIFRHRPRKIVLTVALTLTAAQHVPDFRTIPSGSRLPCANRQFLPTSCGQPIENMPNNLQPESPGENHGDGLLSCRRGVILFVSEVIACVAGMYATLSLLYQWPPR
jgi:hypothetical protein